MRTRQQIGRLSRNKGKAFERQVAHILMVIFGVEVRRTYGQSREGHDAPDVDGTKEKLPFWIEATHGKSPNVFDKMEQALDASDGRRTIVIAKRNRGDPVVCMNVATFRELVHGNYVVKPKESNDELSV